MTRSLKLIALLAVAVLLSRVTWPFDRISAQYAHCEGVDPSLPNVLLIGDSTQIRYYPQVKAGLAGRANVYRIVEWAPQRLHSLFYGGPLLQPVNAGSSAFGAVNVQRWLGGQRWDVVHFNWGLHDLVSTGGSVSDQDARNSAVSDYLQHLQQSLEHLRSTGAALVLATTTPVTSELGYVPDLVEALNQTAVQWANQERVAVNDLYAATRPQLSSLQPPADVHFNDEGTALLAESTVAAILAAL